MRAFYADEQAGHDPRTFMVAGKFVQAEEQPERADRLKAGGVAAGLVFERPEATGMAEISAVHTPAYLRFLETIHDRWSELSNAAPEVIPNQHLDRSLGGIPTSPTGMACYYQADAACPIGPNTWEASRWSAWSAVAAANAVLAGDRAAYALSRPPGHHAYADLAGGFCFLNNSAIAAQMLRRAHDRVVVLDVDVHHGNGTQGIFYQRADVLTVSLHSDPVVYYPFSCGYAHELGAGQGLHYNRNLPLPKTTEDDAYLTALDDALATVRAFSPGAVVLALGLDAYVDDPLKGMCVTTRGFERIGKAVAGLGLPTVIVQEGGYLCDDLGRNLNSFMSGYQEAGASI